MKDAKTYKAIVYLKDKDITHEECVEHNWIDEAGMLVVRTLNDINIYNLVDVISIKACVPFEVRPEQCDGECAHCTPEQEEKVHAPIEEEEIPAPTRVPGQSRVPKRRR